MNPRILSIFDFLRFPLMIGVVMIHCDISDQIGPEFREQWSGNIMYFFSNIIGRFSVPMFFLISGFLFFRNGRINTSLYLTKLRSRVHTLLIPYFIWNTIAFIYFITSVH